MSQDDSSETTHEEAEPMARKMLAAIHDTTEELYRVKLELAFYRERDALQAQVRKHSLAHLTHALG